MITIITTKRLIALHTEQARLEERVAQLETRLREQNRVLDGCEQECAELKDDMRKVFGLKPRTMAAPPEYVTPPHNNGNAGTSDPHLKMGEAPRDYLSRMQREHNKRAREEEQDAIRRAIDEAEEVLKHQ